MLQQACAPENYEADFFLMSGQKLEQFFYKDFIIFIHEGTTKLYWTKPSAISDFELNCAFTWTWYR